MLNRFKYTSTRLLPAATVAARQIGSGLLSGERADVIGCMNIKGYTKFHRENTKKHEERISWNFFSTSWIFVLQKNVSPETNAFRLIERIRKSSCFHDDIFTAEAQRCKGEPFFASSRLRGESIPAHGIQVVKPPGV
jgi:hypothetical protein